MFTKTFWIINCILLAFAILVFILHIIKLNNIKNKLTVRYDKLIEKLKTDRDNTAIIAKLDELQVKLEKCYTQYYCWIAICIFAVLLLVDNFIYNVIR